MTLTSAEHAQVQAATRRRRNALARAKRAAPVYLVRVALRGGGVLLAASSRSTPGAAYELYPTGPGGWGCTCRSYGHRGWCAHTEAMGAPAVLTYKTETRLP